MSLPIRVVGNKARANPRQYSTQAEPAFAHRKAPPMYVDVEFPPLRHASNSIFALWLFNQLMPAVSTHINHA